MKTTAYKDEYASIYIKSGIWETWHRKTFQEYSGKFEKTEVCKLVNDLSKDTVILYGNNGTGKTMLMNLAMKELLHRGKSVQVVDFRNLIKVYTSSWKGESPAMSHVLSVDYLGIDDLGKEFKNEGVSKELANATLDYVLRHRIQREKATWMTFNMRLKDIKTTYNEHLSSLMKRGTTAILFDGEDYGENLITVKSRK